MNKPHEQPYQVRTADAENTIRNIVTVARASNDQAFRSIQKAVASGVLHDWIETTDSRGDAHPSYGTDRTRIIALINTTMLDA